MAEATAISGRVDTSMTCAFLVIVALFFLFGLHKITVSLH